MRRRKRLPRPLHAALCLLAVLLGLTLVRLLCGPTDLMTEKQALRRAQPFETFTDGEIHDLLRSILSAQARGQSVRSCVTALAGGDRTKMLRYQNKYRSILRKKPGLIARVCEEMQAEGLPCPPPPVTVTVRPLSPEKA